MNNPLNISQSIYRRNSRIVRLLTIVGSVSLAGLFSSSLQGQTTTWDAGGGADLRWNISNTYPNFSDDASPVGKHVVFNNAGAAASGATSTQNMGAISLLSLSFLNQGASNNQSLTLTSTAILTLTSGNTGNILRVGGFDGAGSSIVTNAAITGSGQLVLNDSTSNILVGNTNSGAGSNSTASLDMSGLTTFSATINNLIVGGGPRGVGTVRLARNTTITANAIQVSAVANTGVSSGASSLRLGQTNVLNVDTITVGDNKSGIATVLDFDTGLSAGPTVQIRNKAGTGRTALNVGVVSTNPTSSASGGSVNLSGGAVDALLSNVTIGQGGASNTAAVTGAFTFASGTVDANNILIGESRSSSTTTNLVSGTFSMSGGTLVTSGTVTAGKNTSGGQNAAGVVNISGGNATVGTLVLSDKAGTAASVAGTLNLNGGVLNVGTLRKGAGNGTANINWSAGTLNVAQTGLSLSNNGTGILSPGGDGAVGSTGILSGVTGLSFSQGANAVVAIDIASAVSFDTINLVDGAGLSSISFANNSTISIDLLGAYTPIFGQTFDIITADSITAAGSILLGGPDGSNFTYQVIDGGVGADVLRLTAVPEPSAAVLAVFGLVGLRLIFRRRFHVVRN